MKDHEKIIYSGILLLVAIIGAQVTVTTLEPSTVINDHPDAGLIVFAVSFIRIGLSIVLTIGIVNMYEKKLYVTSFLLLTVGNIVLSVFSSLVFKQTLLFVGWTTP